MSTKLITDPETWYGLKLGESANFNDDEWIVRVPGGWLYCKVCYDDMSNENGYSKSRVLKTTFIPFSDEYREDK